MAVVAFEIGAGQADASVVGLVTIPIEQPPGQLFSLDLVKVVLLKDLDAAIEYLDF